MNRWMKWGSAAAVVVAIGVWSAQQLEAAKQAQVAQVRKDHSVPVFNLSGNDIVTAVPHSLVRMVQVSGGLKAVNTALVKAKVAAEVKSLTVREGDKVKAGQVIGQLDTTELVLKVRQAEQTAAASKAQRDIAKRALDNNRALVAQGFISATGLETSNSNAASAQANFQAAVAAVDLARKALKDAKLVAPIAGQVSQRLVQPGERVAVDAKLLEIVDVSRIEIEATVTPEDAAGLQVGQVARMEIDGLPSTVLAKVARINPSTQAGTRAIPVYLALEPQSGLRQGLFAQGGIEVGKQTVLAVPVSTVRIDQALAYVVVLVDGQTRERTVVLGARGEALIGAQRESVVEIKEGLAVGTPVLRGSVGKMRDGTLVRVASPTVSPPVSLPTPVPQAGQGGQKGN
jgi:RND family efflux transporter MFP subunit